MSDPYELGVRLTDASAGDLPGKAGAAYEGMDQVVGGIARFIDAARKLDDQIVALQQRGVLPTLTAHFDEAAAEAGQSVPGTQVADAGADANAMLHPFEQAVSAERTDGSNRAQASDLIVDALGLRGGFVDAGSHRISLDRLQQEREAIHQVLGAGRDGTPPAEMHAVPHQLAPLAQTISDPGQFRAMMGAGALDAGTGNVELNRAAEARREWSMQDGLPDWGRQLRMGLQTHGEWGEASKNAEPGRLARDKTSQEILALSLRSAPQMPAVPGIDTTARTARHNQGSFQGIAAGFNSIGAAAEEYRQQPPPAYNGDYLRRPAPTPHDDAGTHYHPGSGGSAEERTVHMHGEVTLNGVKVGDFVANEIDRPSAGPSFGDTRSSPYQVNLGL